jgi:hypothetical protein
VGKSIASLSENSQEAIACNRFYETARDATLRDHVWPFATKFAALGLVEEEPNDEWGYSYRYPSDCLNVRRILSGYRKDTRDTVVPYKIAQDDSGLLIYTDIENAEVEYTMRASDTQFYPPDFELAFSYRLAYYIAPRVTGGDPFKLQEKVLKLYMYEISRAVASSINEQRSDVEADAELIRIRE